MNDQLSMAIENSSQLGKCQFLKKKNNKWENQQKS